MGRRKDGVLGGGEKEVMEKEYLDFVKGCRYGKKGKGSSCNCVYDDVEKGELRGIVEKVGGRSGYREER